MRQWAVDEMHLRRFAPVVSHCEIYQTVRLIESDERYNEDHRLINDKPTFDKWSLAPRHGSGHTKSGIYFLWERHTEASTVTLILPHNCPDKIRAPYIKWLEQWNGSVVRAVRIFVAPDGSEIKAHLTAQEIDEKEMVCCDVNAGLRIWSDFGIHKDGYGRLFVTAGDVSDDERGRIIQRVQELGNYRNLALLGFPTVQQYGPDVDQLEQQLSDHAKRVANASDDESDENDEDLLQQLANISSQLELIRSATSFRLNATTAYAEVAADRLNALNVQAVANYQSLTDFTERRLVPASRTCSVFRDRLSHIAERISRVMHTLDVGIDTRIKAQNLSLTQSMERSTQLQFRLQTLVEGLSIIAAAYYLVGLIGYVTKGIAAFPSGSKADIFVGAVTLPVILAIYLLVRSLRGKVLKENDANKD
ncbi:DUF3422 domain-containing protein [Parasphingorhabdus cellanae]|uniref:DUF3422 domain-containing protein n=1 Tax=Parasphingorhabdus cellanae TaxID=2806553 RepID=A0ABX7T9U2_9SPHN|nr:DUF3422 domain-containing protein [Parasphingorhabdus cellanae]QTD57344.1 DUF3422 domain-containing protein [Parasphingorhabdus cellanae]